MQKHLIAAVCLIVKMALPWVGPYYISVCDENGHFARPKLTVDTSAEAPDRIYEHVRVDTDALCVVSNHLFICVLKFKLTPLPAPPSSAPARPLEQVRHYGDVGDLEDRRVRVFVDRHDVFGVFHTDDMLDRAGKYFIFLVDAYRTHTTIGANSPSHLD